MRAWFSRLCDTRARASETAPHHQHHARARRARSDDRGVSGSRGSRDMLAPESIEPADSKLQPEPPPLPFRARGALRVRDLRACASDGGRARAVGAHASARACGAPAPFRRAFPPAPAPPPCASRAPGPGRRSPPWTAAAPTSPARRRAPTPSRAGGHPPTPELTHFGPGPGGLGSMDRVDIRGKEGRREAGWGEIPRASKQVCGIE